MSRSQKNVRLRVGSPASEGGRNPSTPEGVTEKDGATNIAGTLERFSTDDYQPAPFPTRNP